MTEKEELNNMNMPTDQNMIMVEADSFPVPDSALSPEVVTESEVIAEEPKEEKKEEEKTVVNPAIHSVIVRMNDILFRVMESSQAAGDYPTLMDDVTLSANELLVGIGALDEVMYTSELNAPTLRITSYEGDTPVVIYCTPYGISIDKSFPYVPQSISDGMAYLLLAKACSRFI